MNQPRAIDLSSLPPEIRQKVEAGLARLPAEVRQKLLDQGSPIIEKAIARAQANLGPRAAKAVATAKAAAAGSHAQPHSVGVVHAAVIPHYDGHYNSTIRPGDRVSMRGWVALAVVAAALAWWWGL